MGTEVVCCRKMLKEARVVLKKDEAEDESLIRVVRWKRENFHASFLYQIE
jgi:hypothetical protein